jgi:hypothetical protein
MIDRELGRPLSEPLELDLSFSFESEWSRFGACLRKFYDGQVYVVGERSIRRRMRYRSSIARAVNPLGLWMVAWITPI